MEFRLKRDVEKSPKKKRKVTESSQTDLSQALHSLPCEIDHDGAANADVMFIPCIRDTDDGGLKVSLLGHGLVGRAEKLPDNYSGVVFEVEDKAGGAAVANCTSTFHEVIPWNWGSAYSAARGVDQARDLIYIADLIHRDS